MADTLLTEEDLSPILGELGKYFYADPENKTGWANGTVDSDGKEGLPQAWMFRVAYVNPDGSFGSGYGFDKERDDIKPSRIGEMQFPPRRRNKEIGAYLGNKFGGIPDFTPDMLKHLNEDEILELLTSMDSSVEKLLPLEVRGIVSGDELYDADGYELPYNEDAYEEFKREVDFNAIVNVLKSIDTDTAMPLEEKLRRNFEKLPDKLKGKLRNGAELSDGEFFTAAVILNDTLHGDTGAFGTGGTVVAPFARKEGSVILTDARGRPYKDNTDIAPNIYNAGEHVYYSGIGLPHSLKSIVKYFMDTNNPKFMRELLNDLKKSDLWKRNDYVSRIRFGKKYEPGSFFGLNVHDMAPSAYDHKGRHSAKSLFDAALGDIAYDSLRSLMLDTGIKNDRVINYLYSLIEGSVKNSYVPSKDFFTNLMSGPYKDYFENFMYQNIVNSINEVLGGSPAKHLLQVAVKPEWLLNTYDALRGKHSTQRDDMFELIAMMFAPVKDLGSGAELAEEGRGLLDYYDRLIQKGRTPKQAYEEAIGDYFGLIRYLVSDDDLKNIRKACIGDIENYLRRKNITSTLTKGPGQ